MKFFFLSLAAALSLILVGCLASPVASSGGIGSRTVVNTNVNAVLEAAQSVFAEYGYSIGPANYPDSIAFDKRAGGFANAMWGSYGNPQTIRVRVNMLPIPGTTNIRLTLKLYSVSSAGESGFEDQRPIGLWKGEFTPIIRKIAQQASGAGRGY